MSHEIESDDQVIYRGAVPWHRIGVPMTGDVSPDEVYRRAFPWEVVMKPLYVRNVDTAMEKPVYTKVPARAAVRNTDGKVLGIHGLNWTPLQNLELVEMFRPLYDAGKIEFETAGSLNGGKRVWALAKIKEGHEADVLKGDPVKKYMILANGHSGDMAALAGLTGTRVVCANTLQAVLDGIETAAIRTIHTKNVVENVRNVFEIIDIANRQFSASVEQWRNLAKADGVNQDDLRAYIKVVFGKKLKNPEAQMAHDLKVERLIDPILELAETGKGIDIPGVKGTWWWAYNSITEYLTHIRGRSEEVRLGSNWFGAGARLNRKAFDKARELAKV